MTIGRAARRAQRTARIGVMFGDATASAALDILELTDLAWHDCYGEVTPPDGVIDDILVCSGGQLAGLAHAALLAVEDFRDLQLAAEERRVNTNEQGSRPETTD